MQTLIIDLRKNPEIETFAADKQPGDRIALYGTIKSLDNQTLQVTLEEAGDDNDAGDSGEMGEMEQGGMGTAAMDGAMPDMMREESSG